MISPDLTVDIGGLTLQNPVMTASGTFGYAREFVPFMDLNRLGAIIVKGLSLTPSRGNPPPRIVETDCGMLNAIGLENVGIDAFIRDKLPFLETLHPPAIANIYGKTIEEYASLAERMEPLDAVRGLEVNISCPNVKEGGVAFGSDPKIAHAGCQGREGKDHQAPDGQTVSQCHRYRPDGQGGRGRRGRCPVGDQHHHRHGRGSFYPAFPKLANITGGLSGPAIKPVALRMVWQTARAVKIPVVGVGGIMNALDALEFMMVGATAVQVGTANFIDPDSTIKIIEGMETWLRNEGLDDVKQLIGTLVTDG